MNIRKAQAEIATMFPEIERLAARFLQLAEQLEPEEFVDLWGRPGREHLRYLMAGGSEEAADLLLEALDYARCVAELTPAALLAEWEEEQKRHLADKAAFPGLLPMAFG